LIPLLSRSPPDGVKPNWSADALQVGHRCDAIRTSGLARGWPSAVLIVRSPCAPGACRGCR